MENWEYEEKIKSFLDRWMRGCKKTFIYQFIFCDVEPPRDSDSGDGSRDDQGDGSWGWREMNENIVNLPLRCLLKQKLSKPVFLTVIVWVWEMMSCCCCSPWMAGTILQAATPRSHWPVCRHCSRVGGRQSAEVSRPEITRFRTNRFRGFRCALFPVNMNNAEAFKVAPVSNLNSHIQILRRTEFNNVFRM